MPNSNEASDNRNEAELAAGGSSERPTMIRWLTFGLACGTSWLLYFHRYAWGVIKKDVMDEFGLNETQAGFLDSAFSISYALFQIPVGLLGDLLGPAIVLTFIIVAWSLCVGSMTLGRGFWSFLSIRLMFGATQAGAYPNLGKVTKSWFPASMRTTMQGFIASFSGRMGGAFAPLIIATLLMGRFGFGWRMTLGLLAGLGIAFAVAFRLLFRDTPKKHPWTNEAEQELIAEGEPPIKENAPIRFSRDPMVLLSYGLLLLHLFTSAFCDMLFVNWIPLFLLEEKELSRESMGIFASLPLIGGAIGGMFGGVLNDWLIRVTGRRGLSRSLVGVSGKLISGALVVFSLMFEDGRTMMVVIMFAKFFTDWSQPTVWGAVTDMGGPAAGRVFGSVNMAGSIGGMMAGPILGSIINTHGWSALFLTIAALFVVSGLCWVKIDTSKPLVTAVEDTDEPHQ